MQRNMPAELPGMWFQLDLELAGLGQEGLMPGPLGLAEAESNWTKWFYWETWQH